MVLTASCGHCGGVIGPIGVPLDAFSTHFATCCWVECFRTGKAGDGLIPERPIRWRREHDEVQAS